MAAQACGQECQRYTHRNSSINKPVACGPSTRLDEYSKFSV
jgi:hypothetical protein